MSAIESKTYVCHRAAAPIVFAADMEEPHVWGTLTKRDSVICNDNDFEIFLDPDGDGEHYMEFFSRVEWEFDYHKGGYLRREGVPCDNWVWSPQGAINMHIPEMWGRVQFSGIAAGQGEEEFRWEESQ